MSAATLSALVLGLAVQAFAWPSPDANSATPSKQDVLTATFQPILTPEQVARLEEPPSAGRMAALFTRQQREAAKRALSARAAAMRDPDELAELARGFQLLDEPQGLVEIGAQLAIYHPKDSRGYSMASDGMLKQGKLKAASELADRALALNPNDKRAQGIRVYLNALKESRHAPENAGDAANSPRTIEAAMIGLPQGAAYKTAAGMAGERPDAALAVGAGRALSSLKPTASRYVPPALAPERKPTPEITPKTPRGALAAAATAAVVTVGSVMLFLGLWPKRLDQDYPWVKPALVGGMLLVGGAISYELAGSYALFGRSVPWRVPKLSNLAGPVGAALTREATKTAPAASAEVAPVVQAVPRLSAMPQVQTGQAAGAAAQQGFQVTKQGYDLVKGGVGQVVLGEYPKYTQLADRMRATRLNVPIPVWEKMTRAQQWEANRRFLDRAIARGDQFVLASDPFRRKTDSFYAMELQYLFDKGYQLNDASTKLIKP